MSAALAGPQADEVRRAIEAVCALQGIDTEAWWRAPRMEWAGLSAADLLSLGALQTLRYRAAEGWVYATRGCSPGVLTDDDVDVMVALAGRSA